MTLAVDTCGFPKNSIHGGGYSSRSRLSEAMATLLHLSQVNFAWRSLALATPGLWAGNFHVTPNMSSTLFKELVVRTGGQPIHLHVLDAGSQHSFWPQVAELIGRCLSLRCDLTRQSYFMEIVWTTSAPLLQFCDIAHNAYTHQAMPFGRQLFDGQAPALRHLRLNDTDMECAAQPVFPLAALIGMSSAGKLENLVQLEMDLSIAVFQSPLLFGATSQDILPSTTLPNVEVLRLTGNPFTIASLLGVLTLPTIITLSVTYAFTSDSLLEAVAQIWEPLFQHFPSVNFPSFRIQSSEIHHTFHLHHSDGRSLQLQFDEQEGQGGIDEAARQALLPLIHLPPNHVNSSQILHGMIWTQLVATPGFAMSVRTVAVSSNSPNSVFPYHVHFLLSAMLAATTLQFDDYASAWEPVWYDLLQDESGLLGHSPLPNISTLSLPTSVLDRVLSNTGLCDLLWSRQGRTPLGRLHFKVSSKPSIFTSSTFRALRDLYRELPIMVIISLEAP